MATCADIIGFDLPDDCGEDSVSMLPLLEGRISSKPRTLSIHHSLSGKFAIRRGDWVLIDAPSGGDNDEPDWIQSNRPQNQSSETGELFNLRRDLGERVNRYHDEPRIVEELQALLNRVKHDSDPGVQG